MVVVCPPSPPHPTSTLPIISSGPWAPTALASSQHGQFGTIKGGVAKWGDTKDLPRVGWDGDGTGEGWEGDWGGDGTGKELGWRRLG